MMALSLINITTTGPAAPAAPPGVAPAEGAFAVLMPIAYPTDPRHEPAPNGKEIGKDMPVDATAPNPLAWLTPPVAPPVSKPLPAHRGEEVPVPTPLIPAVPSSPQATSEQHATIPAVARRITPSVSRPLPDALNEDDTSVAPVMPPPLVDPAAAPSSPIAPVVSVSIPVVMADIAPATPLIAPTMSRPLPALAGESPAEPLPLPVAPAPSTPKQIGATPEPVTAPAILAESPSIVAATPQSSGKTSSATSPPKAHDLPRLVSREPSVAIEMWPAATVPTPPLTTPRIAAAALVFADAIHRATRDDRAPASPDAANLAAASDIKTHVVAPTADAQHGALDLRQEQWPARMIERIDALRDAANANDTSIRLIPDALGKIDVSLKRDGDTVTVQFTAQQAETRQLLADAAPKLAELAEARGLKLSQNNADTASQQQQRQPPATPLAAAPRSARVDDTESSDTRIA